MLWTQTNRLLSTQQVAQFREMLITTQVQHCLSGFCIQVGDESTISFQHREIKLQNVGAREHGHPGGKRKPTSLRETNILCLL